MFGVRDLKPRIQITQTSVECPVMGCSQCVERQRRSFQREERFRCPKHKIYISPTTFEYDCEVDNLLWKNTADLALLEAIKTVKRECRMVRDNSEDALTWNVFRYLETANQLDGFLSWLTGQDQRQTELIYWSYSQTSNRAWPELNKARHEFGEHLQRSSEPDLIALTDRALFFLEAKLTATNENLPSDPKNHKKYLTGGDEWFMRVFTSDFDTVAIRAKKYELFRFWLLGSWMAAQMGLDFYLVNIVPSTREKDIETRFVPHLRLADNRHFKRLAWEDIYRWGAGHAPEGEEKHRWMSYFENKTVGYDRFYNLKKAFSVPSST